MLHTTTHIITLFFGIFEQQHTDTLHIEVHTYKHTY